ncbi:hypothetical protein [Alkalibacterium sp. 20]|uniref:hypothetical protein n=1 Tax=Alkalibacterium sp. 20 TaxID=1798803 RepID=UPI0009000497|nr:hypothetical protein [Alkalibacterium sp. 20]OJF94016.1 hypothetical protein AX762_08075 [Alkalibacterium sp. 20]
MNENEKVRNNKKRFPWIALAVFVVVLLASIVINLNTADFAAEPQFAELAEINPEVMSLGLVFGSVFGVIAGLIGVGFQYLVTKFPTQWIAKDSDVYKNDIWSALFYSSAIVIVIELIALLLDLKMNSVFAVLMSILTTGLFLFFYFSGENKPYHIKKAITIVSVVITGIGIMLSTGAL